MFHKPKSHFPFAVLILSLHLLGNSFPYSWAQDSLSSSFDCGRRDVIEGDSRTKAPWVAGIYAIARPSEPIKFVITGIILSPTTVLTLFGGTYGSPPRGAPKDYHIANPVTTAVAAGIKSTELENVDEHFQLVQVNYILPYSGHDSENKEFHYFIYHLKVPFNLTTPYARAACLPSGLDVRFDSLQRWQFNQAGFAYPPKSIKGDLSLEVRNVTSLPEEQCSNAFRYYYKGNGAVNHIFCGRVSSEVYEDRCFPHGSPIVFEMGSQWFLGGITALIPGRRRGQCSTSTLYMYSKTSLHYNWLIQNIQCGSSQYPCGDDTCVALTNVCDGVPHCKDDSDEDQIFCDANFRCSDEMTEISCNLNGKCIKKTDLCDGKNDCYQGKDEAEARCSLSTPIKPSILESSNKNLFQNPRSNMSACYSIPNSEGVMRTCTTGVEKEIDCENAQIGTWITLSCQQFYISKYRIKSIQMQCKANGFWHPFKPFDCEPNCGILSSDVSPLISHGADATKKEAYPWHAALFKQNEGESTYRYICGASLIEKNALLSAGHCVREIHNDPKASEFFKIVLAPVSSNYEDNRNDAFAKIFDIKRVWVPPTFDSRSLNSDIALIQLAKPVKYGNHIRPVCYLQPGSTSLPDLEEVGKVAGFGKTEKGEFSLSLKYASVPVVDRAKCVQNSDSLETKVANTFCAGNNNETTLCQGDIGGGLAFAEKKGPTARFTIKGIASTGYGKQSKECGEDKYSLFTHVDAFNDWIYEILENFPDK